MPAVSAASVALAPAKINLALHVTGRRSDGYHDIESLAVFTRFGDRIHLEPAAAHEFSITGPFGGDLAADDTNLVIRARDALRRACLGRSGDGLRSSSHPSGFPPVSIRLEKNLPVASGVGGGSSDAAAVLKALNQMWNCGLGEHELAEIARSLGADVPMCLSARPLLAKGIGDLVEPVADFPALALVLVNPGVAVSTPDVFEKLERRDNENLPPLPSKVDFHSLRNWLETTHNHLEPAARSIQPVIGQALAALNKAGSGFSRMSGSGATCFGLFETGNVAKRAAVSIRAKHPTWFVAATRSMAWEANDDGDA
ncbi:4-diphosphocytidyl-2C-methyl-D-erythritol kinase [Mesorhizobium sp. Root157]|nr:4-diphosphocytidyl-2C-methyl-D-erythritol kinase [Mesorhizobium sp. Root157]